MIVAHFEVMLQIKLLPYNFTKEFYPIYLSRKLAIFLEHLFYITPVYERRLQVLKNVQIYCEDILKSTQ